MLEKIFVYVKRILQKSAKNFKYVKITVNVKNGKIYVTYDVTSKFDLSQ